MFNIQKLLMKFGDRVLFENVNLNIKKNHIYGLVGANGSGKSTFLKILSGQVTPSSGTFTHPKNLKIGILNQDYYLFEEDNLIDVVIKGKKELWEAMRQKESLLGKNDLTPQDIERLASLEEKIAYFHGYEAENQAENFLSGLGIDKHKQKQTLSTLSGGYKMRVMLAQLLFNEPDLLLLDEPTNYLDIDTIAWLGLYLKSFKASALVCSHDRQFLNEISQSIIDIDYGSLKTYPGHYEDFVELKREEIIHKSSAIANIEKKQKQLKKFIERFGAKATKAKQARSKEKIVDRLEMERQSHEILPSSRAYPDFVFDMGARLSAIALKVEKITKSYGEKLVLKDISFQVERGEKLAIVGPNGIGKSTLLEIITQNKSADEGRCEFSDSVSWAYFPQLFEQYLDAELSIFDYVKKQCPESSDQKIYDVLGKMLFRGEDVRKKIGFLSGGEKARVVLSRFMLKQYNFLIFDEPTNHLDMESSEMLLKALIEFPGCIVMVSHNRFFIQNLANHILEITHENIISYKGNYQDYLSYRDVDYLNHSQKKERLNSQNKESQVHKKQENKKRRECEKRLISKELELDDINRIMEDPLFFSQSSVEKKKSLFQKKKQIEIELDHLYNEWESLMD